MSIFDDVAIAVGQCSKTVHLSSKFEIFPALPVSHKPALSLPETLFVPTETSPSQNVLNWLFQRKSVVVILDLPDSSSCRAPHQCSEDCEFEKQNLSVSLPVSRYVFLSVTSLPCSLIKKMTCSVFNNNFIYA